MSVLVALIQSPSILGEVSKNVARLEAQCRKAATHGAKILVLPETSITGYLSENLRQNWHLPERPIDPSFQPKLLTKEFAEPSNGPSVQHFLRLAQELSVYITVPFLEYDESGHFYNSVSLVGPAHAGNGVLAHYRKNCPWPFPEKSWATPGDGVEQAIFDTEYGRVGLAICFDIHTILAKYYQKGLWALLYPIAWVGDTGTWFGETLPQRLKTYRCPFHILGANWATRCPESWQGAGNSTVYGPNGAIIAQAQVTPVWKEDIIYAELPTSPPAIAGTDSHTAPLPDPFDLQGYVEKWSGGQINADYWTTGPGVALCGPAEQA